MEYIQTVVDLFLHLDKHLAQVVQNFGVWTYAILFLIVFCETGLVVTPFLPGDSLLFASGAISAQSDLQVNLIFILLTIAAIFGDTVNYWSGKYLGIKVFGRFIRQEHIEKTHQFFEKYGGKTIVIARFVPIVRTFAPFVAGMGKMAYWRFAVYNVAGGIAWVFLFIFGGYFFGNVPMVKNNLTLVILAIIVISILPGVVEFARTRKGNP
jgi:membrane-associated protein